MEFQTLIFVLGIKIDTIRHGEGMVLGTQTFILELEEWEVGHPEGAEPAFLNQAQPAGHMESEVRENPVDRFMGGVRNHHEDITLPCTKAPYQGLLFGLGKELYNIGLQLPVKDLHPGHSLAPKGGYNLEGVLVLEYVFAQVFCLAPDAKALDQPPCLNDLPEYVVLGMLQDVRGILECHPEPQIRPICAVTRHGLLVGHPGEGPGKVYTTHRKHPYSQFFYAFIDEFFVNEGCLQVQLCKFRLAVGAQVFISETPGNLIIPVHAAHHEDLLEELGRLGQGIESPLVHPAGNQIISCPLGSAFGQERGFHFYELQLVKVLPDAFVYLVTFEKDLLH